MRGRFSCLSSDRNESGRFGCPDCNLDIQLKAHAGAFHRSFVNSAHAPKIAAIRERTLPDYALLSYDRDAWNVTDLTILPGHFISEAHVVARPPLKSTAKRAGWIGSNVIIGELPPDAFVRIVEDSRVTSRAGVRGQYAKFDWLRTAPAKSAGWTSDVLREVRKLAPNIGAKFTLTSLYSASEVSLAETHPENRHVRDKIRQQLQVLRDRGIIAFEGSGRYRVVF